jgi:hypothetical protein
MFQFGVLARLKNFELKMLTIFLNFSALKGLHVLFTTLFFAFHRNMQNIFVFFWPENEIVALHAAKVQQVRRTLDDYKCIYSCASRAEKRKTCFDDFISYGQLTSQLYTVIC